MWIQLCLLVTGILVVVPASTSQSQIELSPHARELIDRTFSRGYNRILAANLSPDCLRKSMKALEAAQADNDQMECSTAGQIAYDMYLIASVAFDSIGDLLTDLNTVINGIPICLTQRWYKVPGCLIGEVRSIFNAIVDFWHYDRFYKNTLDTIKEYEKCRAGHASYAVKKILLESARCK